MSTSRPVIGISCYVEPVTRGAFVDQLSAALPIGYVRHVEAAGAMAVVLPPRVDADEEMAREVLGRLDAVVIAGGADVEPSRYAVAPDGIHPAVQRARPDRDGWEISLVLASAAVGLPTLGICRGMQVMAVAAGGTLEQHVPDRVGHDEHAPLVGVYARHPVTAIPGTRVADILGTGVIDVPTYHHQSVLTHPGYVAAARHEDGTLEAMEDPSAPFRLGVQWHPEAGEDPRLFRALVAAATR